MGAVELAYESWGSPSQHSLVLIHGAGGCGRVWEPVARELADQYHLVAPDLRGHGASPRTDSYQPEEYLRDIEAFVVSRGLASFTLVGHALGGLLCLGYASRHPDHVRALVAGDVNIPPPPWQVDFLRAAGTKPHLVFSSRAEAMNYFRKALSPAATTEILEMVADAVLTADPGGLTLNFDRETLRQCTPLDVTRELASVRCPTLFLRGSESQVMERAGAIAVLHQIARAQLVQIPRSGHYLFLDNPTAIAHELRLFLADVLDADPV